MKIIRELGYVAFMSIVAYSLIDLLITLNITSFSFLDQLLTYCVFSLSFLHVAKTWSEILVK